MPCQHGGTCVGIVNGYICNCTEDYMGVNCEQSYEVCGINPCQNNGTCIPGLNKHDFICECLTGKNYNLTLVYKLKVLLNIHTCY